MKQLLFTLALLLAIPAAKADLLYFLANAFDYESPLYFDYAMIGVAQYDGKNWNLNWGDDGTSKMYLHLYDSENAAIGGSSAAATETEVAASLDAYTRSTDPKSRYTSVGWADVSDYTTANYKFYVETYSNDEDDPVMTCFDGEAKSYAELLSEGHVYIAGLTNPQDVTPWSVPEPASGLLLLVGAGLAAWRRRRKFLASSGSRLVPRVSCPRARARDSRPETRD